MLDQNTDDLFFYDPCSLHCPSLRKVGLSFQIQKNPVAGQMPYTIGLSKPISCNLIKNQYQTSRFLGGKAMGNILFLMSIFSH